MILQACRVFLVCTALAAAVAHAEGPTPADSGKSAAQVYTRGTVKSTFDADAGARHYVQLRLGPRSGLPFATSTFRVPDPAVLKPFPPGSGVEFIAQRVNGENTLVAIRPAP